MIYSTNYAHIYNKPGKYRITVSKDSIPGNIYNSNCKILKNNQPNGVVVKYCMDIPTCIADNTAIIQNSGLVDIIPDYEDGNFNRIASQFLSAESKEYTIPEGSSLTKERFEVMMQELFNFASLQYKSACNTLKDAVKIGYRITDDLTSDSQLSNATLDEYLLARNNVAGKEISSIDTMLEQSRQYGIYGCQKVLSSYKRMLSSDVMTSEVLKSIACEISTHVMAVTESSGQKTFTLNAKDLVDQKFSSYSFTTNKIQLSSIDDLSNINQTLIEAIYIPDDVESLPDGFLSDAINLKHIYFNCDASKPRIMSIGENAFYKAFKLVSLVFPNSLTSIGNNAFHDCVNLQYVKFTNRDTAFDVNNVFTLLKKENCAFIPALEHRLLTARHNKNQLKRTLFSAESQQHYHQYVSKGDTHVADASISPAGMRVKSAQILVQTGSTPLLGPFGDIYSKLKDDLWNLGKSIFDYFAGGTSWDGIGDFLGDALKFLLDAYGIYGVGTGDPSAIIDLLGSAKLDRYDRFWIAAAARDYIIQRTFHNVETCVGPTFDPYGPCDKPHICSDSYNTENTGSAYGTAKIPDGTTSRLHTGNSIIDATLDGMADAGLQIGAQNGAQSVGQITAEEEAKKQASDAYDAIAKSIKDEITPCP